MPSRGVSRIVKLEKRVVAQKVITESGTYQVVTDGKVLCQRIPEPRDSTARLIEAAGVIIPEVMVARGIRAATRKKLVNNRKSV